MHRISIKGVIVGAVVDIVGRFIVSMPLLVVAAVKLNLLQYPRRVHRGSHRQAC